MLMKDEGCLAVSREDLENEERALELEAMEGREPKDTENRATGGKCLVWQLSLQ